MIHVHDEQCILGGTESELCAAVDCQLLGEQRVIIARIMQPVRRLEASAPGDGTSDYDADSNNCREDRGHDGHEKRWIGSFLAFDGRRCHQSVEVGRGPAPDTLVS